MNNNSFLQGLYQSGLNRQPDAAGLNYWTGQMQDGASRQDVRNRIAHTPEGQLNSIYGDLLGRAPDQTGMQHYMGLFSDLGGTMGMRRDIQAQPEYQNRLLGGPPASVSQGAGRQAVAGINAMPGVFSDYAYSGAGNPQIANQVMRHQGQGAQMMPNLLEMLIGAFAPAQEDASAEEDVIEAEKKKKKGDGEATAFTGLRDFGLSF